MLSFFGESKGTNRIIELPQVTQHAYVPFRNTDQTFPPAANPLFLKKNNIWIRSTEILCCTVAQCAGQKRTNCDANKQSANLHLS